MSIQIVNKKRAVLFVGIVFLVIFGLAFGIISWRKKANKDSESDPVQVYAALVQIVDEKIADPAEDKRSSLKAGDVISIVPENHEWSETEKISYLIVKLEIKQSEAQKLMQPEEKTFKREQKEGELPQPDKEIVRARAYRIDLDFDKQKFWEDQKQPFGDKVFDESIIEKK